MHKIQKEENSISNSTNEMVNVYHMELCVKMMGTLLVHALPQKYAPDSEAKVEDSQHHSSCTGSFAAPFPSEVGAGGKEPQQYIEKRVFPDVVGLAASMIAHCIVLDQCENSQEENGVGVDDIDHNRGKFQTRGHSCRHAAFLSTEATMEEEDYTLSSDAGPRCATTES